MSIFNAKSEDLKACVTRYWNRHYQSHTSFLTSTREWDFSLFKIFLAAMRICLITHGARLENAQRNSYSHTQSLFVPFTMGKSQHFLQTHVVCKQHSK